MRAKPFLKWAGGKTQLIKEIQLHLPQYIYEERFTYVEPFVGSGALLFWMFDQFPNMEKAIINDINTDLIGCYETIKTDVIPLIDILARWQDEYYKLEDNDDLKKEYYYSKRDAFNKRDCNKIEQSALFIFLNKTCFNGLFRVNRKNEYNVPIGRYKKPLICNEENLLKVSEMLQKVTILNGDYAETLDYVEMQEPATPHSFFYFDPPYKPLSKTSSFNAYAKDEFGDEQQILLANFCRKLDRLGYHWILSNSDVKDQNIDDNFFDDLYANFNISRVKATRSINANASKRGKLKELLITNR